MSGYPALNFLTKLVQTLTDALARHIQGYQEMAAAGFSVYDLWQARFMQSLHSVWGKANDTSE